MSEKMRILIVEDEMMIGAKLSLHLEKLGYDVAGIIPRGEEAIAHVQSNQPDLIFMDIQLNGAMDGIETAAKIKSTHDIPIIFLTANADDSHFERAKETKPEAFISKPYSVKDIKRAIELALSRLSEEEIEIEETAFQLNDRIFVKMKEQRVKLLIQDIIFIESDRNYCNIHTHDHIYTLAVTLKVMDTKLPSEHFLRVHRSYIVNQSAIDAVAENYLVIQKKPIPISKAYKAVIANRLNLI